MVADGLASDAARPPGVNGDSIASLKKQNPSPARPPPRKAYATRRPVGSITTFRGVLLWLDSRLMYSCG